MYTTATAQPIGVMRRVTCTRPGYYPRGICVPIPHLDELKHTYPIPSRTSTVVACLVEGRAVELPISFDSSLGYWLLEVGRMKHSGVVVDDDHTFVGMEVTTLKQLLQKEAKGD